MMRLFVMPVSWLQLWAFSGCGLIFFVLLLRNLSRRGPELGAQRDRRSQLGIAVQSLGIGLLLFALALAVALGHWMQLLIALPLFLAGTAIRTRSEDHLLEQSFGSAFQDYRNTTPALIPRLF
jgi:hypothetical protein